MEDDMRTEVADVGVVQTPVQEENEDIPIMEYSDSSSKTNPLLVMEC